MRLSSLKLYGPQQEELYRSEVPLPVTRAYGEMIIEQYAITADQAEERWLSEEAADALPNYRRAEIETATLKLRGLGAGVEAALNAAGNHHHREVIAGRVVITQSKVESKTGPIRDAVFRRSLAMKSQTISMNLLDDEPDATTTGEVDRLWACFVHMPSKRLDRPAFIRIAFPFPDGTWDWYVDLFDLIPDLVGYANSPALVTLRDEQRKRRGAAG